MYTFALTIIITVIQWRWWWWLGHRTGQQMSPTTCAANHTPSQNETKTTWAQNNWFKLVLAVTIRWIAARATVRYWWLNDKWRSLLHFVFVIFPFRLSPTDLASKWQNNNEWLRLNRNKKQLLIVIMFLWWVAWPDSSPLQFIGNDVVRCFCNRFLSTNQLF